MKNLRANALNYLFIAALMIFGISCDKDDEDTEQPNRLDYTYTNIGSSGGTHENGAFLMDVSSGTFSKDISIGSTEETSGDKFGSHEASKFYTVSGIPENYTKSIRFGITPNSTLSGDVYMVVSVDAFSPSAQSDVKQDNFILATKEDDGKYYISIDPITEKNGYPEDEDLPMTIGLVSGYTRVASSEAKAANSSHFYIYIPDTCKSDGILLGQYLEDAYTKIGQNGVGFLYTKRTSWPMSVVVKAPRTEKEKDMEGYFERSKLGDNYGSMFININNIANKDLMKILCGHEFMHFAQSLYDPRLAYFKAVLGGPFLWLNEASAVCIETMFQDDPDYIANVQSSNYIEPYKGMDTPEGADATNHGYGMSEFIKYLEKNKGANILNYYVKYYSGEALTPALAISNIIDDDLASLWLEFIEKYSSGEIDPTVKPRYLVNEYANPDVINVNLDWNTVNLSTAEYSVDYPGYSCKIFKVTDMTELDSGETPVNLIIESSSLFGKTFAYKLNASNVVKETYVGYDSLIIQNFSDFTQDDYLVVVTTSPWISTHEDETVKFTLEQPKEINITGIYLSALFDANIQLDFSDKTLSQTGSSYVSFERLGGETKDGVYKIDSDGVSCTIKINNETLLASGTISYDYTETDGDRRVGSFSFKDIKLTYHGTYKIPTYICEEKGTNCISHISDWKSILHSKSEGGTFYTCTFVSFTSTQSSISGLTIKLYSE